MELTGRELNLAGMRECGDEGMRRGDPGLAAVWL
jgi:hypothetical protein